MAGAQFPGGRADAGRGDTEAGPDTWACRGLELVPLRATDPRQRVSQETALYADSKCSLSFRVVTAVWIGVL